jgi:hypothetical protein
MSTKALDPLSTFGDDEALLPVSIRQFAALVVKSFVEIIFLLQSSK